MLGGLLTVKKIILILIFNLLMFSCKNTEVVQNENTGYLEIEEQLSLWHISEAEALLNDLDEQNREKYTQIINEKKSKLNQLYSLEKLIKNAFFSGDFTSLDNYMRLGTIDNFKYQKLKEYQISGVKLYIGDRNFLNNQLNEIAVMNLYEESIYVDLSLQYEGDDWFIKSFDEKR